ncbi:signal peptidase I [Marmoricola sp. URHB0036]|uniref:signal peptidase I n=1 Tax=Marmoricola sp. URHB0036 TaxID=1298863 RepID=UPI000488F3B4|nr:signal peptidase I [Marmoricola sp. URHB0036]
MAWGVVVVVLGTIIATGAVAWHEGYRVYAVKTGSMTPGLPVGSLLIDEPPSPPYHRGDVVTIERPQDATNPRVTHRVFSVGLHGGIRTKGDANSEPDVFVAKPSNVIGEVVGHINNGGYVLVYFSQWTGVLSLMMIVLMVWLAWGMCFPAAESADASESSPRASRLRVPRQRQPAPTAADVVVPDTQPDRAPVAPDGTPVEGKRIPTPRGPSA